MTDTKKFIQLCKKHIMDPTLDSVVQTLWVSNEDCNIFIVGEIHNPHTRCTGILDMFKSLLKDKDPDIEIDLMIEYFQGDLKDINEDDYTENDGNVQLNHVRAYFNKCIQHHTCPIRVHWTDPTKSSPHLPEWLNELYTDLIFQRQWWTNEKITPFFNIFYDKTEIIKLITENSVLVKEIEKASAVNPHFNLEFVIQVFMYIYFKTKKFDENLFAAQRCIMDFYTIARIIKSRMKHVIFYAGNNHINRTMIILNALQFVTREQLNGSCFTGINSKPIKNINFTTLHYEIGKFYKQNKNNEVALKYFKLSSDEGNTKASYELGGMYYNHIPSDKLKAIYYYKLAADKIVDHYNHGYNYESRQASFLLAKMYYTGDGIPINKLEALHYYKKAAYNGNIVSIDECMRVAEMYYTGDGIPIDKLLAARYYKLVADEELTGSDEINNVIFMAQFILGVMYYKGDGVPQNKIDAVKYITLSSKGGNTSAKDFLKTIRGGKTKRSIPKQKTRKIIKLKY